jgi:hypothetical protein
MRLCLYLQSLRAENKLQAYLTTKGSSDSLLALANAVPTADKHAQRVLRVLLAAEKGTLKERRWCDAHRDAHSLTTVTPSWNPHAAEYGCTMRNEQGDTLLTALARRQTGGAASDEIPTLRPEVFSSLVLKLVEHGADLFERNADGENFFHVIARDHQSLALLKALLAAIEKKDVAASTSAQNGESGAGEADMDVEVDGVQSTPAADKKESIVKGSGEEETLPEQHRGLKAQIRQALQARNARGQTPLLTAVRPYAHAACHNTEVVQSRIRLLPNAHFALSILPP